jgi:LacI family transcriptional regulator
MRQLADDLGVSVSTVSRALSKDGSISGALKQRILEAAAARNYRIRRKSRAGQITYFIDKRFFLLTNHFYNRVIEGIESESKRLGFTFHFNSLEPDSFSLESVPMGSVAGMIITSSYHDEFIGEVSRSGVPFVLLDYYIPTERHNAVLIDNTSGVTIAVQHLASLGHRRVAYVRGDIDEIGSRDRMEGYLRSLEFFDLAKDSSLVVDCDFSLKGAYVATRKLLQTVRPRPTAIMCVNDMVAFGAMEAVKEAGLAIPRDISVMGFDDIDLASQVLPHLSTVHIPKAELGRLALTRLLQVMHGEDLGFDKILVTPRVVARESTGAAPAG